ncbi:GntR family transcriptional regulator [Sphingobium sp. H39-3-25]|uniref:GntR family transcriptional regulator n=1 Tax=Sphingobium arseniciresistens TaxID=3030834 RepID=UPI0023B91D20|nr:GntR family transcriptional regulator [Sphingobium arseniciresistens]
MVADSRLKKETFGTRIAVELRKSILEGKILPGSSIVESALAEQFGVSRGPLREAIRELVDEGILVQVPFTGTRVIDLSVKDVQEIYSMRTALETFAFELVWDQRNDDFFDEIHKRQKALDRAIDNGDEMVSILTELDLHSVVFEASHHSILQHVWAGLRGRLQLYWSANHRAHGRKGPKRDAHDSYVAAACGDSITALRTEIADHMQRGYEQTINYLSKNK